MCSTTASDQPRSASWSRVLHPPLTANCFSISSKLSACSGLIGPAGLVRDILVCLVVSAIESCYLARCERKLFDRVVSQRKRRWRGTSYDDVLYGLAPACRCFAAPFLYKYPSRSIATLRPSASVLRLQRMDARQESARGGEDLD